MFDVHEIFGIIEPLKKGEIEGLLELLESDRGISRGVRDAMIELLKKNPPRKPRGRPNEDMTDATLFRICRHFVDYTEDEKLTVESSLEKLVKDFNMSTSTLKNYIYSDLGKKFREAAISQKPNSKKS